MHSNCATMQPKCGPLLTQNATELLLGLLHNYSSASKIYPDKMKYTFQYYQVSQAYDTCLHRSKHTLQATT